MTEWPDRLAPRPFRVLIIDDDRAFAGALAAAGAGMTEWPDRLEPRTFRVLIIDDHRAFAEALAARLSEESDIEVAGLAFSMASALAIAAKTKPDVILLDLMLAEESGLSLLEGIRALQPVPAVIVVSGVTDVDTIIDSMAAGAEAFMPKSAPIGELLTATHEVVQGRAWLPANMLGPVITRLIAQSRGSDSEQTFVGSLSPREMEVLRCLVQGMTRAEVGERLFVSTNTVRTHVQNILKEAGVHSTLALVALARESGVVGIDEPPRIPQSRSSDWSQ